MTIGKELLAVQRVAVPGSVVQSLVATGLGALAARTIGWDWTSGIVFGLALSVASTVVLVRVLSDHHDLHTPVGHIAVGWLVGEDLFTVLILVLMPVVFAQGAGLEAGSYTLAMTVGVMPFSRQPRDRLAGRAVPDDDGAVRPFERWFSDSRVSCDAGERGDHPRRARAESDLVFSGEGEVALAFTEAILRELGASPDQIDRERARVHQEIGGRAP